MKPEAPHLWLFEHAKRQPDAPALDTPGERVSYGALAQRVRALASSLLDAGLEKGERVLVALPASPAAAIAALAVQAAGGCAAEVSPASGPRILAAVVAQVRPRRAFLHARNLATWRLVPGLEALEQAWLVGGEAALGKASVEPLSEGGELAGAVAARPLPCVNAEQPALILFTSGSTSAPRGVVLSARNLASNARAIATYLRLDAADRAMLVLPLTYAYGRSVLHSHLCAGGSVFLDDRFMYPRVVVEALAEERCTNFSGVPATYELLRRAVPELRAPTCLRKLTQAGGAMARDTTRWVRTAFAPAPLYVMYGQTEATARLSYLPPEHASAKEGSIGIAIPGTELRVLDAEGRELPAGEVGELVARGPGVALGYLNAPEEQARAFREGALWTGDLAYRDAGGFFFLVERAKEILKVAGHRVSPAQIEAVLAGEPGVLEAAVVGLPDPVEGEVPAAAVVAGPGCEVSPEALRRRCRELLGPVSVPRVLLLVEALPRSEVGKVLRRDVARLIAASAPRWGAA